VGFAAETHDVEANAAATLARKPVDLLVVNDVSAPGAGFESDTNEVRIMSPSGTTQQVDRRDKRAVARAVLDAVAARRATT
jgi:phosphopantothenoylcysteine decarboxylase / phosphopantothenate---cysteine ligase